MSIQSELLRDGAAIYQKALPADHLTDLRSYGRERADACCQLIPGGSLDSVAAIVSPTIDVYKRAILRGADILTEIGFSDVRWLAGSLVPKWPREVRRIWHVDWWGWESTIDSWRTTPPQIGILMYIDDARLDNGALLVLPGSHRREIIGHHEIWESRDSWPTEKALPVPAGDAVLLDPRILHAVTANTTCLQRLCMTLWYMLDFSNLTMETRATSMQSIGGRSFAELGPLCPTFTNGNFTDHCFPFVKKPQFPLTFSRIEALANSVGGSDAWYYGVAAAKAPLRIMDIGVHSGHSLLAMVRGAAWAGEVRDVSLVGIHVETDCVDDTVTAASNLMPIQFRQFRMNTRDFNSVGAVLRGMKFEYEHGSHGAYDIIHVDGDHSPEGIEAEIRIADAWIKPSGVILVDDVDIAHVAAAVTRFAKRIGVEPVLLPTKHGTVMIDVRKRTR